MGSMYSHLRGEYQGHSIEIEARTVGVGNLGKVVEYRLVIDKQSMDEVKADTSGIWTLRGRIFGVGEPKAVVVEIRKQLLWPTRYRLRIDGMDLSLLKVA
jgi:hypothetical protein